MWSILNYLVYPGSVGIVGFCLLYYYDKHAVNDIIYSASWQFVKTYHKVNLEI